MTIQCAASLTPRCDQGYLQQVRAGRGCPAGSSRGTSAGRGFAERGRWDECAAGQRRDRLTRCSPLSLQRSLHWGAEAEKTNHTRGTVTLPIKALMIQSAFPAAKTT